CFKSPARSVANAVSSSFRVAKPTKVLPARTLKSTSGKGSTPRLGLPVSGSTWATSLRKRRSLQISTASAKRVDVEETAIEVRHAPDKGVELRIEFALGFTLPEAVVEEFEEEAAIEGVKLVFAGERAD